MIFWLTILSGIIAGLPEQAQASVRSLSTSAEIVQYVHFAEVSFDHQEAQLLVSFSWEDLASALSLDGLPAATSAPQWRIATSARRSARALVSTPIFSKPWDPTAPTRGPPALS